MRRATAILALLLATGYAVRAGAPQVRYATEPASGRGVIVSPATGGIHFAVHLQHNLKDGDDPRDFEMKPGTPCTILYRTIQTLLPGQRGETTFRFLRIQVRHNGRNAEGWVEEREVRR